MEIEILGGEVDLDEMEIGRKIVEPVVAALVEIDSKLDALTKAIGKLELAILRQIALGQ